MAARAGVLRIAGLWVVAAAVALATASATTACDAILGVDPIGAAADSGTRTQDGGAADVLAGDVGGDVGCQPSTAGGAATLAGLNCGLVAYWAFDGNATDKTDGGSTLSAQPAGGQPVFMTGKFGQALYQYALDDNCTNCVGFISAPRPALEFNGDFTISLWAKHLANAGPDSEWGNYGILANDQVSLLAIGTTGRVPPFYPTMTLTGGTGLPANVQDTSFNFYGPNHSGDWTHFVAYRRGDTAGIRINGQETTHTVTGPLVTAGTFYLGLQGMGYNWQGLLDEVGKWNRALTSVEMEALYNNGMGRAYPF